MDFYFPPFHYILNIVIFDVNVFAFQTICSALNQRNNELIIAKHIYQFILHIKFQIIHETFDPDRIADCCVACNILSFHCVLSQETTVLPNKNTYPLVNFLSSVSLAKSASVNHFISNSSSPKYNFILLVIWRYLNIRFTACQCALPGLD